MKTRMNLNFVEVVMIKEATIDDLKQVVKIVMKYRDFYGVDEQSVEDVEKFMKSRFENQQSKVFIATSDAIGRDSESEKSSLTTARPPLFSITVFTASAIISDEYPTTIMLCESCATDDAIAPFLRPNPFMNAFVIVFPP